MNIRQIKERLNLETVLRSIGSEPDERKSRGADLWYRSPFRPGEAEPSFHINTKHDIYKDFGGDGAGGDLIHFAQAYLSHLGKSGSVKNALEWLKEIFGIDGQTKPVMRKFAKSEAEESQSSIQDFEMIEDASLSITSLLVNLDKRKIDRQIAAHYWRQIKFRRPESIKMLFGYGFRNRQGGYDFSNPLGFKTVLGHKDITHIEGHDGRCVEVFEGASDFLTRLSITGDIKPTFDVVVLNSTHLHGQASRFIQSKAYSNIALWLDNDDSGFKATTSIMKYLEEMTFPTRIVQMNSIYAGFKDLNKWHVETALPVAHKRLLIEQKLRYFLPDHDDIAPAL